MIVNRGGGGSASVAYRPAANLRQRLRQVMERAVGNLVLRQSPSPWVRGWAVVRAVVTIAVLGLVVDRLSGVTGPQLS